MTENNIPNTANYVALVLRVDPEIAKALKIMAINEGIGMGRLAGEAIVAWIKGLAKITYDEYKTEDRTAERAAAEEDLREVIKLQSSVRTKDRAIRIANNKRKAKYRKAVRSLKNWNKAFPGKPWPWFGEHKAEGMVPTGRKRGRPRKDNVLGTTI